MQELSTVLTSLSVAAGLALGVERILEVLKHFMALDNGFLHERERSDALARTRESINRATNAIHSATGNLPSDVVSLVDGNTTGLSSLAHTSTRGEATVNSSSLSAIDSTTAGSATIDISSQTSSAGTALSAGDTESDERFPAPRIPVIAATIPPYFATAKSVFILLAAAGLGMIFSYIFDLRLLSVFLDGYGVIASDAVLSFDIVFTGIVIGGGSQPIHLLIRFLSERSVSLDRSDSGIQPRESSGADVGEATPVRDTSVSWRDIDYRGGVHPERLEKVHVRPANPNLIVYHHTAMASSKTFQDIVDEFVVNKKWLTGYHCVIMPDGGIRPFCRWDRYGNHAKGLNARSLGIAFHGNFHTEPTDKYANADGRYGNQAPTDVQLRAGARVVALWVNLYEEIELDFDTAILAHREAMPEHTVCPGSNFPVATFQQLICDYHESWAGSDIAQQRIAAFKQLNYVYAT